MDYPALLYALIVGVGSVTVERTGGRLRLAGWMLAGAAVPVGFLAVYHEAAFGAWWITSYQARAIPLDGHFPAEMGVWRFLPDREKIWRALFSPTCGVFFYNPVLPLGLLASGVLAWRSREERRWLWVCAFALQLAVLGYFCSLPRTLDPSWGSYGARYTIYATPVGLLALVPWILRIDWPRWVWGAVCAVIALPGWMYLFYGSPSLGSITEYWKLFLERGPAGYTLYKAGEAGWVSRSIFAWAGFCGLLVSCFAVWAWPSLGLCLGRWLAFRKRASV
jgi:hypothetical protein